MEGSMLCCSTLDGMVQLWIGLNMLKKSPNDVKADDANKQHIDEDATPTQEEEVIKKKYGGVLPKKPPLISMDHERAYFDSADWALEKQGAPADEKPKGPLEALRPKLQPTQHHQARSRKSAYAPADGEDESTSSEDPSG